jgi:DNA-binding transcriptional regulator YdaS (Cro superfamily)
MNIKTFVRSTEKLERERIAALAGTTDAYFHQLAGGHRRPSASLCKRLEVASGGLLNKEQLRPDIYS